MPLPAFCLRAENSFCHDRFFYSISYRPNDFAFTFWRIALIWGGIGPYIYIHKGYISISKRRFFPFFFHAIKPHRIIPSAHKFSSRRRRLFTWPSAFALLQLIHRVKYQIDFSNGFSPWCIKGQTGLTICNPFLYKFSPKDCSLFILSFWYLIQQLHHFLALLA